MNDKNGWIDAGAEDIGIEEVRMSGVEGMTGYGDG